MLRLCWDEIERVRLNKVGKLVRMWGVPKYEMSVEYLEFAENCLWCGDDYLKTVDINNKYCSKECKNNHTKWKAAKRRIIKMNKSKKNKARKKHERDLRCKEKEEYSKRFWAMRKEIDGWAKYNTKTVQELLWCGDLRRNKNNNLLAEAKCTKCGEWFIPTSESTLRRYKAIIIKEGTGQDFYCSKECKESCVLSYMTTKQIILRDAINAGRVWMNMEDKWKYYDWQNDYKKLIEKKQKEYKSYLKQLKREKRMKKEKKKKKERDKCRKIKKQQEIKTRRRLKLATKGFPIDYYERLHQIKDRNEQARFKHSIRKKYNPKLHKIKQLLYYSRVRAKEKNCLNNLDEDWITDKIEKNCPKTKLPFSFSSDKSRDPFAPSIDRIDNNKGYTKDNCQLVIWAYNTAKAEFTDEDVYKMAKAYLTNEK